MSYQPAPYETWDQILASIRPGNYLTVHGGGTMGALIRTFTHAPVAHAVVYVGAQPDGTNAMEATPSGVSPCNLRRSYDPKTAYPSRRQLTPNESAAMVKAALDGRGKPYGWLADFFLGIREGFHGWVPDWAFKLNAVTTHEECAQFADYVAIMAEVHYFTDGRAPGAVSPADLWRLDYH